MAETQMHNHGESARCTTTAETQIDHDGGADARSRRSRKCTIIAKMQIHDHSEGADRLRQMRRYTITMDTQAWTQMYDQTQTQIEPSVSTHLIANPIACASFPRLAH